MLGALALAGFIALAAPALAQQQAPFIDPDASVVNEQTLLRELPRIQGDIDQLDERARVLIQPAGRVWDHFHEVTLYWLGAVVILGTLAALVVAYLSSDAFASRRGDRDARCRASRHSSGSRIGSPPCRSSFSVLPG
jgi:formate dehydrogenase subunit gamma